jgi:hypothetical protein
VPAEHVASGLVKMPADGTDPAQAARGLFRVHSCPGRGLIVVCEEFRQPTGRGRPSRRGAHDRSRFHDAVS